MHTDNFFDFESWRTDFFSTNFMFCVGLQTVSLIAFFIKAGEINQVIILFFIASLLFTQHFYTLHQNTTVSHFSIEMALFTLFLLTILPVISMIGLHILAFFKESKLNGLKESLHPKDVALRSHQDLTPKLQAQLKVAHQNIDHTFLNGHKSLDKALKTSIDPETRRKAVLSTRSLNDYQAIPLLKIAIMDTDDDVRLIAYSLLENRENKCLKKLHQIKQSLKNLSHVSEIARNHHIIARYYFKLGEVGLYDEAMSEHYLKIAYKHSQQALELGRINTDLSRLISSIEDKLHNFIEMELSTFTNREVISNVS